AISAALYRNALQDAHISDILRLAGQAQNVHERLPQRGLLLGLEAFHRSSADEPSFPAAEESLRDALGTAGGSPLRGHTAPINAMPCSLAGLCLASTILATTALLCQGDHPQRPPAVLRGHADHVLAVAFSPDSREVVTGSSSDNLARVWQVDA